LPVEPTQPDRDPLKRLREAVTSGALLPAADKISSVASHEYYDEKRDLENQHLRAQVQGLVQDTAQRKTYASFTFFLVFAWLVVVAVILFLDGFRPAGFYLAPSVVMVLLGSTTTGVVGLFLIVTRYLFPTSAESKTVKKFVRRSPRKTSAPSENS
jgi:hypothetical protein